MNLNPLSLFGLGKKPDFKNPADSALPYMQNIPGMVKPIYDPYMNAGQNSLSTLMSQYNSLINDPAKVMNMLGSGFQESPGYQFNMNQGMNAAKNAAASGGMLGTQAHQNDAASIASNLANQEYMNYLGNAMNLYTGGLNGLSGINEMGYGASNEYGNTLGNNQMNMANMSYLGQSNQNQSNMNAYNNKMGLLGALGGGLMGSGVMGRLGGSLLSKFGL